VKTEMEWGKSRAGGHVFNYERSVEVVVVTTERKSIGNEMGVRSLIR